MQGKFTPPLLLLFSLFLFFFSPPGRLPWCGGGLRFYEVKARGGDVYATRRKITPYLPLPFFFPLFFWYRTKKTTFPRITDKEKSRYLLGFPFPSLFPFFLPTPLFSLSAQRTIRSFSKKERSKDLFRFPPPFFFFPSPFFQSYTWKRGIGRYEVDAGMFSSLSFFSLFFSLLFFPFLFFPSPRRDIRKGRKSVAVGRPPFFFSSFFFLFFCSPFFFFSLPLSPPIGFRDLWIAEESLAFFLLLPFPPFFSFSSSPKWL